MPTAASTATAIPPAIAPELIPPDGAAAALVLGSEADCAATAPPALFVTTTWCVETTVVGSSGCARSAHANDTATQSLP
jgi:hypothetical protein